ncbi:DUF4328 domain-containing protein [Streptomyces acidiscabies]|uniref:DUF4328 domain-containing protein n=1 Tax=Streptomyces acidiscabies TaxID=42234 RepID=UPI00211709EF|nr:DUF4328 domain-containing protein [Streptomyces acidiscabies]
MSVAWLRSPVGLGRATAVLLGAVVVAQLFAVWVGSVTYRAYGDLADGNDVIERAVDADRLENLAAVVQTPPLVVAVVVYLCWFWRVRVNAEVFEPGGHTKTRGWTIGGWFVPVVNLWFPRRVMVDVWKASAPLGRTVSHGLVNAWWAAWVLWILAGRVMSVAYRRAETPAEIRDLSGVTMVTDTVEAVAGVLAILVVLRVTRMQNEKAMAGAALPVG